MNLLQGKPTADLFLFVLASVLPLGLTFKDLDSKNINKAILCGRNHADKFSHLTSKHSTRH